MIAVNLSLVLRQTDMFHALDSTQLSSAQTFKPLLVFDLPWPLALLGKGIILKRKEGMWSSKSSILKALFCSPSGKGGIF